MKYALAEVDCGRGAGFDAEAFLLEDGDAFGGRWADGWMAAGRLIVFLGVVVFGDALAFEFGVDLVPTGIRSVVVSKKK
jgi:hypothetical protein